MRKREIMKFTCQSLTAILLSAGLAFSSAQELRYPDDAPVNLLRERTLQTFGSGTFLEGVAFDKAGTLYVSGLFNGRGGVWYHKTDGTTGTYPQGGGTLALHPGGTMYVGVPQGDFSDPATLSVRVVRLLPGDKLETAFAFPKGTSPNGLTFDERGNLFAADSVLGRVWKVPAGGTEGEVWLDYGAFKPAGPQGIPGVNGIAFHDGAIFTVNSSSGDVFKVPFQDDGAAGVPERYTTGLTGDGISFDDEGNLYVTTHPFNRLYSVSKSGKKTIIGNAENQVIGATDATFHRGKLYVVTDGGLFLDMVPPDLAQAFAPDRSAASVLEFSLDQKSVR